MLEFGEASLVRLEFLRSGGGIRQNVEREHNIFLSAEVAQPYNPAVLIAQREIGRAVPQA